MSESYQPALQGARLAVASATGAVRQDSQLQTTADATRSYEQQQADAAAARLATDQQALVAAAAADAAAAAQLARARARVEDLAIGLYTSGGPVLVPPSVESLEAAEQELAARDEVEAAATQVLGQLEAARKAAVAAHEAHLMLSARVAADRTSLSAAQAGAAEAASEAASAAARLASDQRRLATAQAALAADLAAEKAAVAAVLGPSSSTGGISILGPSALDASQLAAWYLASGYSDLTPASVAQLASWYVEEGAAEGVRGDIAFAQAVHETGGFSSLDAVSLNNYAGIGHCDSCSSGWAFPSPQAGVMGQLQLLRIFADPGGPPPGAPPPVLAALTPGREQLAGCCRTWESLTGTWATDPSYGAEVLSLYQQMLDFALGRPG